MSGSGLHHQIPSSHAEAGAAVAHAQPQADCKRPGLKGRAPYIRPVIVGAQQSRLTMQTMIRVRRNTRQFHQMRREAMRYWSGNSWYILVEFKER